jgi:hypothetical protein
MLKFTFLPFSCKKIIVGNHWLGDWMGPRVSLGTVGNISNFVKFEVFTAVTMNSGVIREVTPCGSYKNYTA